MKTLFKIVFSLLVISCQDVHKKTEAIPNAEVDSKIDEVKNIQSPTSIPKDKGISKEETITWLNSKFGGDQPVIYSNNFYSFSSHLEIERDGSFTTTHHQNMFDGNNNIVANEKTTFSGHFKDLSTSSINVRVIEGIRPHSSKSYYYVFVGCLSVNCIKQRSYSKDYPFLTEYNNNEVLMFIVTDNMDKTLIERGTKAITHLIELSGGKKEVY